MNPLKTVTSKTLFLALIIFAIVGCKSSDDSTIEPLSLLGDWRTIQVNSNKTIFWPNNTISSHSCSTSESTGRILFEENSGTFVNQSRCSLAPGWDFTYEWDQQNEQILFLSERDGNIIWKILFLDESRLIIEWDEWNGRGGNGWHNEITSFITFEKE